jgi:hypothetical protein
MRANEKRIKALEEERTVKDQPHFQSIMLTPSRFSSSERKHWMAVFNMVPSIWKAGRLRTRDYRWVNATWRCDGKPASVVGGGCPEGTGFVIQCPQGDDTRINKVTVYPQNYTLAQKMTYRVRDHVDCELDHPLRIPARDTDVVATAYVFGFIARSPHHLLEWIEYHRMIGVGHFYLYVMESYSPEDWNLLPNLPYITYVPWEFLKNSRHKKARSKILAFQISHQTDVLYRSRAHNVSFVTFNDIDEYIQLMGDDKVIDLNRFVEGDPEIGALMGNTIMFGHEKHIEKPHDYLIEYVYRSTRPVEGRREKCFVRPKYADYYNNHHVSLGNKTSFIDPWRHLRYNHYKKASTGVFLPFATTKNITEDSSLRDGYLTRLKRRVNDVKLMMIESNKGWIRNEWSLFDHME